MSSQYCPRKKKCREYNKSGFILGFVTVQAGGTESRIAWGLKKLLMDFLTLKIRTKSDVAGGRASYQPHHVGQICRPRSRSCKAVRSLVSPRLSPALLRLLPPCDWALLGQLPPPGSLAHPHKCLPRCFCLQCVFPEHSYPCFKTPLFTAASGSPARPSFGSGRASTFLALSCHGP